MNLTITRRDGTVHTVLFDAADEALVKAHTWHVHEECSDRGLFYAVTNIRRPDGRQATLTMHRLLTNAADVDHANVNGLDNRRSNLRPATRSQQCVNRRPILGASSSFKGVSWNKIRGKWRADIKVNQQPRFLGHFDSELEAAETYDRAALNAWGDFAYLNFDLSRSPAA